MIGVVLSGAMDDGAAGLAAVKAGGGIAVVQDPHDALFSDMPVHALERTVADHVAAADTIGDLLVRLVNSYGAGGEALPSEVPLETVEEHRSRGRHARPVNWAPPPNSPAPTARARCMTSERATTFAFAAAWATRTRKKQ